MRKDIILNEVFTELTKSIRAEERFIIEPTDLNYNFNQVRNYIDYSRSPNDLGNFKNTKEHREHYMNLQDSIRADYYISVSHAEMKRVQQEEMKKAIDLMEYRSKTNDIKEDHKAHNYENIIDKVEKKHAYEKAIFEFHDKVVRNEAPNEDEYNRLEKTLIDFKSFDNPKYKDELKSKEEVYKFNERLLQNIELRKEQNKTYNQQFEEKQAEWAYKEEVNKVSIRLNNEYKFTEKHLKPQALEKINKFNNDPDYQKEMMDAHFEKIKQAELKENQAQRDKNWETSPFKRKQEFEIKQEKLREKENDIKYAETGGVVIDKELYKEAMESSNEIKDMFDIQRNKANQTNDVVGKIKNVRANAWDLENETTNTQAPIVNDIKAPEIKADTVSPTITPHIAQAEVVNNNINKAEETPLQEVKATQPLEANLTTQNDFKQPTAPEIKAEAVAKVEDSASYRLPDDYNPFDQENIDQWRLDLAKHIESLKNSPEAEQFKIQPKEEYKPTEFGPTNAQKEVQAQEVKQSDTVSYELKNWDEQSPEVKTALFNQEQRLKEQGIEFKSVIPAENNKVMTEEYYSKHPEKKVVAEQMEAIKNAPVQKDEIKEQQTQKQEVKLENQEVQPQPEEKKNEVIRNIQKMRMS